MTRSEMLAAIFASQARVVLLQTLLLDPSRPYYQRQLEAATGLPIRAIQRELDRLSSIGMLYRWEEGNRTNYQVDMDFPLYPELRGMVMKTVGAVGALRGALALDEGVRLAFLAKSRDRALVVARPGRTPDTAFSGPISVEIMNSDAFLQALSESRALLEPFLADGVDLLGSRDDVIWRHIAAAGYDVKKGEGVP